ncbi:MAG: rhodanese superfamily protein [Alphaproteobacteria bacterium ADurb.BinA280]|jgi:UPF0176 protein|nr:sulfurtransferase [Aquimonas sp.]OPZ13115.1 MAG: rhodanese superfamily protein [Alphaproteobacteria bacterium ADurb.BinA280]
MITNIAVYHFTPLEDRDALARLFRDHAARDGLKGTVLLTPEGINLFLAGTPEAIAALLDTLRAQPRFVDLQVKYSFSHAMPFERFKVKFKSEIITFRHPELKPGEGRAPSVLPADLQRWLQQGRDDAGKPVVMLDTRNEEEFAYGTFQNALTLPIRKFTELPTALAPHREALKDATVVSFCTGGIRCEKAAIWMHNTGMDNVLQLEGGILGYFEQVGGEGYQGDCFVFDQRVALRPDLTPLVDAQVTPQVLVSVG